MNPSVTKAMVLAAGEGTRLRPLTLSLPKAMVPIGGRPLIEHTIEWLRSYGIGEVGINLHYLGHRIVDCLGDGSRFGLKVKYSQEEELLGTAGGVRRMAALMNLLPGSGSNVQGVGDRNIENRASNVESFVVVYGDVLTDFDLGDMVNSHAQNAAFVTIALSAVPNPHEKGIVEVDDAGRICGFFEKPPRGTETGNLANGGIYILNSGVLIDVPPGGYADFGFDVFPSLLSRGIPLYGYVLKQGDYLLDIGSMDNYFQANEDYPRLSLRDRPDIGERRGNFPGAASA